MYLRYYLQDIPLKALKVIADTLNIKVEYRARIKLLNAIDMAFWDGSLIRQLIKELSENQRTVLSILAFSYQAGVREQALSRKMERLCGLQKSETQTIAHDLIPYGIVGGISEDDSVYFCPGGVAEQVRKEFIVNIVHIPEKSEQTPFMTSPNLVEDIFAFLARIYKTPIPLTLKGRIKKKVLDTIFVGSPTSDDLELNFPAEHRNAFIIRYIETRGLIKSGQNEMVMTTKLGGWLDLSMTERYRDIISFALTYTLHDHATIIAFTGIVNELAAGSSFGAVELANFVHSNTPATGGLLRLDTRVLDIINILTQMGLFSFSQGRYTLTRTGEQFFRGDTLSIDENMGDNFTIQPNFEVIVGPELLPRIRFLLELMSERVSRDIVLTYIVTQEGIARAREHGMSTDDIIDFFRKHSRNAVPQNVLFSIENWSKSYGKVFFEKVTLMRFRDYETCNSVLHLPEVAPYIVETLSDTAIIVASSHITHITEALRKTGFLPEAFGKTPPDPVRSGTGYTPDTIFSQLALHTIPDTRHTFILPGRIFDDNDEESQ